MIAIFTRTNGVKMAISVYNLATITPNALDTIQTIDLVSGASIQVPGTLASVVQQFRSVIPQSSSGFVMRIP